MVLPEPGQKVVLEFATHSDDEMIPAAAVKQDLRARNYWIGVVGVSLGRREELEIRQAEMLEGCARAGFEPIIPPEPFRLSETEKDNLASAHPKMVDYFATLIEKYRPDLIISPTPHDNHPAHEVVGRAARDSIKQVGKATPETPIRWWMHALWGHAIAHTIFAPYDEDTMEKIQTALGAYTSQIAHTNYPELVWSEGILRKNKGPQLVFGSGSAQITDLPYAEVFTEVIYENGQWNEGEHRTLDLEQPFTKGRSGKFLDWLLDKPSDYQTYRDL